VPKPENAVKLEAECCEKYLRKRKVCKSCPLVAGLGKKQRRKWVKRQAKLRKKQQQQTGSLKDVA
jgi:hypothetical protein